MHHIKEPFTGAHFLNVHLNRLLTQSQWVVTELSEITKNDVGPITYAEPVGLVFLSESFVSRYEINSVDLMLQSLKLC